MEQVLLDMEGQSAAFAFICSFLNSRPDIIEHWDSNCGRNSISDGSKTLVAGEIS